MDYLTHEDFKAQNSKVNCQSHTTSSSLCYLPILNILIILYTVPYFTRGFQDEHHEKAEAVGSVVYEDLGASKSVYGSNNGEGETGHLTTKPGGLKGLDSNGKKL